MTASESSPPIKTLSGFSKSLIAVPSAKNSGLDKTEKVLKVSFFLFSLLVVLSISFIACAVRTGRVLFLSLLYIHLRI